MKFVYNGVLLQEVPNHISLGFTLLGCTRHCKGCHSYQYWDTNVSPDFGTEFTSNNIAEILLDPVFVNDFKHCSCLAFFGGDWQITKFAETIEKLKSRVPRKKYCWYTGMTEKELDMYPAVTDLFDYIKLGPYIEEKGPITKTGSNQRYVGKSWNDLTHLFNPFNVKV